VHENLFLPCFWQAASHRKNLSPPVTAGHNPPSLVGKGFACEKAIF